MQFGFMLLSYCFPLSDDKSKMITYNKETALYNAGFIAFGGDYSPVGLAPE